MILARIRTSLIFRATMAVLLGALCVGLAGHLVAEPYLLQAVERRQRQSLEAVLDVVAQSAAAACFARDRALAKEVTHGLVTAQFVQGAVLRAEGMVLAADVRPKATTGGAPLRRSLENPFTPGTFVGELELTPDPEAVARQVEATIRIFRFALALFTGVMGLVLAVVVYHLVTRPIRHLSRRLHHLDVTTGGRLALPSGHEGDEIGQLVRNVNTLLERLVAVLDQERLLVHRAERDHRKLQAILNHAGTGILVLDRQGGLEHWNPASLRLLDLAAPPPAGATLPALFGMAAAPVEEALEQVLTGGGHRDVTLLMDGFLDEPVRWLELSLDPIDREAVLGELTDVTSHQQATEAAQELAIRDPLTGIFNRLGADRLLAERLAAHTLGLGVMLVDLDRFKEVNDTFGHDAGDVVLREATERFARTLRRTDHLARLGGDEFLIMVEGLVNPDVALALGAKLVAALQEPIPLPGGVGAHIGASIGIALVAPGAQADPEDVLKRADQAMYRVKQAGRNGAQLAD